MYKWIIILLLAGCATTHAPTENREMKEVETNLHQHIEYLSDDKLEGRRTGTPGEKLASAYIKSQFEKYRLTPKGTDGYLQPFEINEGKMVSLASHLYFNGESLALNTDYFPLAYTANISIDAMPSIALQEHGLPWLFDLKDVLKENAKNPHFDVSQFIADRAKVFKAKGATALIVYNTSTLADGLAFDGKDKTETASIPVLYISKATATRFLHDPTAALEIKLKTDVVPKMRSGENVVGYIDNGAPKTIVIGAHFDHLGYGEDKNSRYLGAEKMIHNGADDNASGTAAMIELARLLKASGAKNDNYLFIAFSGEELGLYGSKYFTSNPTIPIQNISCMVNMDMVGRLNDSSRVVTVGGYGTSPLWSQLYNGDLGKNIYRDAITFRFDSSGTGPSDHTSFYLKDIPVLFYFTGTHSDYHTPTDDFNKINYAGEAAVVMHIYSLLEKIQSQSGKIPFLKTREVQTGTNTRFSVSLGIMPDYTYTGIGVRVDAVSDDKPAKKAGLMAGDIIINLGGAPVSTLELYMQQLAKFKKGEQAPITYTRGDQTVATIVQF